MIFTDHDKTVSMPEAVPASWATRSVCGLAVQGEQWGGGLTHSTAADVRSQLLLSTYGHHGDGLTCGQPEAGSSTPRIGTYMADVTEHVRHRGESLHTGACGACRIIIYIYNNNNNWNISLTFIEYKEYLSA